MNCPGCTGPTLDPVDGLGRAPVMLVADALEPYSKGRWQIGRFGKQMDLQLQKHFGMRLTDFQFGCAAACAPSASQLRRCALECRQLDAHIAQRPPKVFVTLDPLATERLTGIRAPQIVLRGYVYPERQGRGWVIPTMPLGGKAKGPTLEQSPGMWVTWRADIAKALRVAQEDYAYESPHIFARPSRAAWDAYVREFLLDPSRPLAVDTEFPYKRKAEMSEEEKSAALDLTHRIDEVNLAFEGDRGGSVPWSDPYREGVLAMLHASQQHGTTLFWNTQADAPRLTASGGPRFRAATTEDLMDVCRVWRNSISRRLAVAASLWPSMHYAAPWKHLGTEDAYYRGMDAIALVRGRLDMHAALRAEGAWDIYQTCVKRLDPLLERMTDAGLAVNVARAEDLHRTITADMVTMQREMTALVPPEVRKLHVWKSRAAAEAGLARLVAAGEADPDTELEPVEGEAKTKRCSRCGMLGVTAGHARKKTLDSAPSEA